MNWNKNCLQSSLSVTAERTHLTSVRLIASLNVVAGDDKADSLKGAGPWPLWGSCSSGGKTVAHQSEGRWFDSGRTKASLGKTLNPTLYEMLEST